MILRKLTCTILICGLFGPALAPADSVIEFDVATGWHNSVQPVIIKDGTILVKSAGGDENLDILYEQAAERLILIDHQKKRFTPVTDERVGQIARQAEEIQPLIQGFSEQFRKLSPKQRAKWENMLGGISLDQFDSVKREAQSTTLMKTGAGRKVAGIACEEMNLLKGKARTARFCLANPSALKLSANDAATLRALIGFTQRLAARAQGLGSQFGIAFPASGIAELAGVPVEMREYGGKHPRAMTLSRVSAEAVADDALKVPDGYRSKELALW
ncbi:hypothetical protein [Methylomagnum sp.]